MDKPMIERCGHCIYKKIYYNNENLQKIFLKSLPSIDTTKLIRDAVTVSDNKLLAYDCKYDLNEYKCYVVGFGKAVFKMALAIESILGENLVRGICSVPIGMLSTGDNRKMAEGSKIEFYEGAKDNIPDEAAVATTKLISELAAGLTKNDLLIVLISGGGSALLSYPKEPISLEQKIGIIKELVRKGASIDELNCVRKRLSNIKGGGLARLAFPAYVISFILSDVINDPIDIIASGPTSRNTDTLIGAWNIFKRYDMLKTLPESVNEIVSDFVMPDEEINLNPLGNYFHVDNYIIGNNKILAEAAKADAIRRGYSSCILTLTLRNEVSKLSKAYVKLCIAVCDLIRESSNTEKFKKIMTEIKPQLDLSDGSIEELCSLDYKSCKGVCLILCGEPVVKLRKQYGKGGRNTHLALNFAIDLHARNEMSNNFNKMNISLLSCGTDGIDGPTDAAGAIGTIDLCDLASKEDLSPNRYCRNFDSYTFFEKFQEGKYLIKTGHTGTNVMDIHMLIINKGYDILNENEWKFNIECKDTCIQRCPCDDIRKRDK